MTDYKVFQEIPQGASDTILHVSTVQGVDSAEEAVEVTILHLDAINNGDGRQGFGEVSYVNPNVHLISTRNLYAIPEKHFHVFDGDKTAEVMAHQ